MTRKDCKSNFEAHECAAALAASPDRGPCASRPGPTGVAVLVAMFCVAFVEPAHGGTVRVLRQAVVIHPEIRVCDVAEPEGFTPAEQEELCDVVVADAPVAGGSRIVPLSKVREALAANGVNLARTSIVGATRCDVARPVEHNASSTVDPGSMSTPASTLRGRVDDASDASRRAGSDSHAAGAGRGINNETALAVNDATTLRSFVVSHFNREVSRYGGRADVVFDRGAEDVLRLSGPEYTFSMRQRKGPVLGLVSLEIDLIHDGVLVQTLPVVARVTMVRPALLARRAINQGATVGTGDVEVSERTHDRVDDLPLSDGASAVGLRASRFIPAGAALDMDALEQAPVVLRGQLVALKSSIGGVSVVTTAKAAEDGLLGQSIRVRAPDNKRVEFDAIVIGPGRVQVGDAPPAPSGGQQGEKLAVHVGHGDE